VMHTKAIRTRTTQKTHKIWWAKKVVDVSPKFLIYLSENKVNEILLFRDLQDLYITQTFK
jgi:hypothetical protein